MRQCLADGMEAKLSAGAVLLTREAAEGSFFDVYREGNAGTADESGIPANFKGGTG